MRKTRINWEKAGHLSKSLEMNPVDDDKDAAWKKDWRNASLHTQPCAEAKLAAISTVDAATRPT